jgi:hypothetical protein
MNGLSDCADWSKLAFRRHHPKSHHALHIHRKKDPAHQNTFQASQKQFPTHLNPFTNLQKVDLTRD